MIHGIHSLVWGPGLIALLLGTGGYFTWRSRIFQIRGLGVWWRATVGSLAGRKGKKDRTGGFRTVCTALAATIGTGNIAGVATALAAGGPGAVFWMWVSAFLGMMTAYAEVSLGIRWRRRLPDGSWLGGPCAYLSGGLQTPALAVLYGILCLCASLGMGSMVQSNAVSQTLFQTAEIPPLISAVTVTALVTGIILGGAERIARVSSWMIPLAAAVYIAGALAVLFICRGRILWALAEIFQGAMVPRAVFSGAGGYGVLLAFRYGVARGVFSNEAGLGTLAGLHGAVEDTTPQEQGMWAMFEVFFDTIIICTVTALAILCVLGDGLKTCGRAGAALAGWCFGNVLGAAGEYLVSLSMIVFAFSTMIAWYYLGRQTLGAVTELVMEMSMKGAEEKEKEDAGASAVMSDAARMLSVRSFAESIYLLLYVFAVFLGCVSSLTAAWELSDIFNGLMAFPNLLALWILRKQVL